MRIFLPLPATMIAVVACATGALAQAQITVGPNVHVSNARPTSAHNEVTIAADPGNASNLIACSMLDGGVAAYVSHDGGASWSAGPSKTGAPRANDPTCAYGPKGTAYFAHKLKEVPGPSDIDRLIVHRSRDAGRTWLEPIRGPQTTDRPWIAVDTRAEHGAWGRLYVSYNYHVHFEDTQLAHKGDEFLNAVALQGSSNGGESFNTFATRALRGDAAHPFRQAGMSGTVVLSDGTVLFLYEHAVGGGANPRTGKMMVVRSALMVARSRDGGDSLEPAFEVADITTSYNEPHTRGVTGSIAADPGSTRFRDRVYATWADARSGRAEIMVAHSTDAGASWSEPLRISDAPARADGGPDHFMPTVAVNGDGVVGVLWYDRRDNPDNRSYFARFSASLDGGLTWLPSVRVATHAHQAKGDAGFGVTGGDTAGLCAAADNRFHALWVDTRSGRQQVWTAAISVTAR